MSMKSTFDVDKKSILRNILIYYISYGKSLYIIHIEIIKYWKDNVESIDPCQCFAVESNKVVKK